MRYLVMILLVLCLLGEYEVGEMLGEPNVQYKGHNGKVAILCDYNQVGDGYMFIPVNSKGIYVVSLNGVVYEMQPSGQTKIKLYRREP